MDTKESKPHNGTKPIPLELITEERLKNFWSKVDKTGDCWIWTACTDANGYGRGSWSFDRVTFAYYAHRISYALAYGNHEPGLVTDHLCRNTSCVRPDHLEVVTNQENNLRGVSPSSKNARKLECPSGHAYSGGNTYTRPDRKGRGCLACRDISNKVSNARVIRARKAAKESNGTRVHNNSGT